MAAAQEGSFPRAAAKLGASQSALSYGGCDIDRRQSPRCPVCGAKREQEHASDVCGTVRLCQQCSKSNADVSQADGVSRTQVWCYRQETVSPKAERLVTEVDVSLEARILDLG